MFKPKKNKEKTEEIKEVVETVEEPEEEIEDEVISEETSEEVEEESIDEKEKPVEEQKVNLTQGEVISIVEFNLQRAVQSLQLLK